MAGCSSFRADSRRSRGIASCGAAAPTAASVLGADYNAGDHPVIAGRGALCFGAALCGDCTRGATRRVCDDLFRAACTSFWRLRVRAGAAQRSRAFGSKRLSVRRNHVSDRAVSASDGTRMGDRASSVR